MESVPAPWLNSGLKKLIFQRDKLKIIACGLRAVVQYTQTDSNGMALNPLICFPFIGETCLITGTFSILLVHWYDWYQWNNIYSIGIPLVKCISLWGLRIFPFACFRLSGAAFYFSIGPIGTNGIRCIPLVFHRWNASHTLYLAFVWARKLKNEDYFAFSAFGLAHFM